MKKTLFFVLCAIAMNLSAQKSELNSSLQVNYLKQLAKDMDSFGVDNFVSTKVDTNTMYLILAGSFTADYQNLYVIQKGNIQKEVIQSLKIMFVKSGGKEKLDKDVRKSYKKMFNSFAKLASKNETSLAESQRLLAWWLTQDKSTSKALKVLCKQYQKDINTELSVK